MQKWLDNDDILLYLTHNKEKTVDAKRFERTLKSKINKWMTTSDGRYCDRYWVKLADEYNKSYRLVLVKNLFILIILLWLKELRWILNHQTCENQNKWWESELLSMKIFLGYTNNWSRGIFLIDSVMKTKPWMDKIE